jgi:hypothetical protein
MHSTRDWIAPNSSNAITIHHNADWSGEVYVEFSLQERALTRVRWILSGKGLLTGTIPDRVLAHDDARRTYEVPASVIARAVALANRSYLSSKVIRFGEDLLSLDLEPRPGAR